ncbi:MAG: choice-of-anchor Q domain-containing protein [Myxococcota bacterium]
MKSSTRALSLVAPVLGGLMLCSFASEASAAAFIVTSNADENDDDLTDDLCITASGTCTLRAAIEQANAIDTEAHTIDIPGVVGTIVITQTGVPNNDAAWGDLDIDGDITIVGDGNIIDGNGTDRIFHVLIGASLTASELTLQNGWGDTSGGAIYNQADLTLIDSTLIFNTSTGEGGGIESIAGSSTVLEGCRITENSSTRGGGVYSAGDLEIVDSTIDLNVATYGAGLYLTHTGAPAASITGSFIGTNDATSQGGGIWTSRPVDILGTRIEANSADDFGGGIYAYFGDAVVDVFKSDLVGNAADNGGGLYNNRGDTALRRVNVVFNTATTAGGGIYNQGPLIMRRSAVFNNDAAAGAGLYNYFFDADLTALNTTFSGNDATGTGGGLWLGSNSTARFNNVTVTNNTGLGGGLQAWAGASAEFINTLVAGNVDGGGLPSDCSGPIVSNGHNLIEDTAACTITGPATNDIYATAPDLGPLSMNGGRSPTHELLPTSAALEAGDAATCRGVDQRGEPRPGGAVCDIGSFERQ